MVAHLILTAGGGNGGSTLPTGKIPNELGRLTSLRMLNVSSNGFTGELPSAVCALPALEVLSTARNRLSGDLLGPAAALGAVRGRPSCPFTRHMYDPPLTFFCVSCVSPAFV